MLNGRSKWPSLFDNGWVLESGFAMSVLIFLEFWPRIQVYDYDTSLSYLGSLALLPSRLTFSTLLPEGCAWP